MSQHSPKGKADSGAPSLFLVLLMWHLGRLALTRSIRHFISGLRIDGMRIFISLCLYPYILLYEYIYIYKTMYKRVDLMEKNDDCISVLLPPCCPSDQLVQQQCFSFSTLSIRPSHLTLPAVNPRALRHSLAVFDAEMFLPALRLFLPRTLDVVWPRLDVMLVRAQDSCSAVNLQHGL